MADNNSIAIFTNSGDLHSSVVADVLAERGINVRLVFTDKMSSSHKVSVSIGEGTYLSDINGETFNLNRCKAAWWRRIDYTQKGNDIENEEQSRFVNNEWSETLLSGLSSRSSINWVSDPVKTKYYSNKILQLELAVKLGFNVPKTYVTNSLDKISDVINDPRTLVTG